MFKQFIRYIAIKYCGCSKALTAKEVLLRAEQIIIAKPVVDTGGGDWRSAPDTQIQIKGHTILYLRSLQNKV